MTDYTELKRLAEAVNKTYADLCEQGGDQLAEAWNSAELAYDDAANPDVVLALIAENEALRKDAERYRFIRLFKSFWIRICLTDLDASVDLCMNTGKGEQP